MTKKVIFRADGNSTIGLGHLYRLFSLVEIVKHTFNFVFLVQERSTTAVMPKDYSVAVIPNSIEIGEEPEWLASNFSPEEYCIIVDGYGFNGPYQQSLKQKGFGLMYVDDLVKVHMYADVVINHSPYVREDEYSKEKYTKLALGTNYAMLRPLFLEAAKKSRKIDKIDSAFICFGGADPLALTLSAVHAMLQIPSIKYIHVVLGASYHKKDIFDLAQRHRDKINVHKNLSEKDLLKIMHRCNFAIAPASTILYELCCVNMPILSGFYVDNQESIYKGFLQRGAVYGAGNIKKYQSSDFVNDVQAIIKKRSHSEQIKVQNELFDAEIVQRHLKLIGAL